MAGGVSNPGSDLSGNDDVSVCLLQTGIGQLHLQSISTPHVDKVVWPLDDSLIIGGWDVVGCV